MQEDWETGNTQLYNYNNSTDRIEVGMNRTVTSSGLWIRHYFLYFITVVGSLSNILALIVVALSRRMRTSPSGVLLMSLTAIDTIVLLCERLQTMANSQLGSQRLVTSTLSLTILYYLKYTGRCAASFVVACISVNRFAVVVYPLKSEWFMRSSNAVLQVVSSVILAFLMNIFILIYPPLKRNANNHGYFIGHVAVEIVVSDILISLLILVLSGITAHTFIKTEQSIRRHTDSYYDPSSKVKKANERQVTILLLVVSLTYVILRMQYKIVWLPVFFLDNVIGQSVPSSLQMAYYITYCIYILNYATNLYQYCVCSSIFRKEFQRLFCNQAPYGTSQRMRKISSSSQKSHHSLTGSHGGSNHSTCKTHHTMF